MKVLLPVDGSACSEGTLRWTAGLLSKENTQYYLLYVIKQLPEIPYESYEVEEANAVLKHCREVLESLGCQVVKADYVIGDPVEDILRYADRETVDQILMGSHGRSGLSKLLLGSVSSAVLEKSKRPVFVYKNVEAHQPDAVSSNVS